MAAFLKFQSLRILVSKPRFVLALASLLFVLALSFWKSYLVKDLKSHALQLSQSHYQNLTKLYIENFERDFDVGFKPQIEAFLKSDPYIESIQIIAVGSRNGEVLFDSADLKSTKILKKSINPELNVHSDQPILINKKMGLGVYMGSSEKVAVYFLFKFTKIYSKLATVFLLGFACFVVFFFRIKKTRSKKHKLMVFKPYFHRTLSFFSGLRGKFILAISIINVVTALILFFSLSYVQKREQTSRLVKDSILFSEFSTDSIVNQFGSYFYFYFEEKFQPYVQKLIAANENLISIKIISKRSDTVIYDSQYTHNSAESLPQQIELMGSKSGFSQKVQDALRLGKTFSQVIEVARNKKVMQVITVYQNENKEMPFYLEFKFSLDRLEQNIASIQRQILIDLIPSTLLGIIIVSLLAYYLIRPIRRLVKATQLIRNGQFDVRVQATSTDEIGELVQNFNSMASELEKKGELKKYLSQHSYRRITESEGKSARISGARVKATVLFCDIRNFVNACELMDADEVTSMLNSYFSKMVEVIYRHKGEIDKFIGDAILAVFYEQDDVSPINAIHCAVEMREKLLEFNFKRVRDQKIPIEIGIGINYGELISGPIGSPDRMDFTVIGDVVNVASRIEKLSKLGQYTRILFSNNVEKKVRGLVEYQELSRDKIRGKEEEVTVYELVKLINIDELINNLSSESPLIKKDSIELLGYSSQILALSRLIQMLSDENESVRMAAVLAVARLAPKSHESTIRSLFEHLEIENSLRVVSAILQALGRLCEDTHLLRLTPFLNHSDDRVVANAIEALGSAQSPHIIDLLVPYLSSNSNRIKANAAMVLFHKGRYEVIEALRPMLLNSDPTMRASAAFALGELTVTANAENISKQFKEKMNLALSQRLRQFLGEIQSCVPMLVSLLRDQDLNVRRQAIIALGKIKDKSAVLPLIDCLEERTIESKYLLSEISDALRSIGSHQLVREVLKQFAA